MVKELVRDAILIKLKIRQESPLISPAEFCFAAGLGAAKMNLSEAELEAIRKIDDFEELKKQMREYVNASADTIWEAFPEGERLKRLLLGCRVRETLTDEAKELFEMGIEYY